MSPKDELQQLVDVLSDYECGHLLRAVQDIAAGERSWEGDIGIFYNEYIKIRYANYARNPGSVMDASMMTQDGIFAPVPIIKSYPGTARTQLPPPQHLDAPLSDLLLNRRSRRDFTGNAISLVQLATLLDHSSGTTGAVPAYGYSHMPLRSFPSSGGLQAPEAYLFAQAVDDLLPGLYHYHPIDRALESIRAGQYGPMLRTLVPALPNIEASAVVFVVTGCYERLVWKYGPRAYRYMCMDTGFLGENLYLAAEALKLGCCAIAGFVDDAIEEFIGIDGQKEMTLLVAAIGVL